jgi:hypothetical protein
MKKEHTRVISRGDITGLGARSESKKEFLKGHSWLIYRSILKLEYVRHVLFNSFMDQKQG